MANSFIDKNDPFERLFLWFFRILIACAVILVALRVCVVVAGLTMAPDLLDTLIEKFSGGQTQVPVPELFDLLVQYF